MGDEITLIENVLNNSTIAGVTWVFGLMLAFFCLIMITRNTSKWKILLFPVLIGLSQIGLNQSGVLIILAGILYVLEAIGVDIINMVITKK